jgi:putative hydrolase of the HAD superfamily
MVYPPEVRAVYLDAVGTLLHPDPPAPMVYAAVGRRHGSRLDAATIATRFRSAFGREEAVDRAHSWRTSETREQERWRHIITAVFDDVPDSDVCFRELFHHFSRPDAWRLDSDAATVVNVFIQRGYLLGIASNYDSRLRSVVRGLSQLAKVHHLVISAEVGWRKPSPEFFAAVERQAGSPPEQILFVGDDLTNDYQGARSAGMAAVLVDPKGLETESAVIRVARLRDLISP